MMGIQVCSNKKPGHLQRGDNYKNVKIGWDHLKIFFCRTICPSLTRPGTNHPWGRGFKLLQRKGLALLQGEIIENIEIHTEIFLRIFFYRTSKLELIKLGTIYLWMKGIQVCSIKGPGPVQRRDYHKNVKIVWGHLRTMMPEMLNITRKLSDLERRQVG
jgi:hypothetical protein